MWTQLRRRPRVIDLTDGALPIPRREQAPAPTTCASCEHQAPLLQMVGSAVALCSRCFGAMYALSR